MAGEQVFVVEGSAEAPDDARPVSAEEERALGALLPLRLDEILFVASAVARQFPGECPVEVVSLVLELAGVALSFQARTSERRTAHDNANEDYLALRLPTREQLQIPEGVRVGRCALVVADCTSRDQGWATDGRELNGTYRGCWSWNELALSKPDAQGELQEAKRTGFCTNHRADRTERHHRRYYRSPHELLEQVELGDTLRVVMRSQFPGWSNTAMSASLSVSFAVEFEEDFEFPEVPFPEDAAPREQLNEAWTPISCSIQ